MRRIAVGMSMMAATGCATVPSGESAQADAAGQAEAVQTCKAEPAQALVGQPASEALAADAMRLSGARALRWIPHDGIVTMDYREDRLNIELDPANKVTRIRCG